MDFENESMENKISFNEVIDALLDVENTFPPKMLYRLSGLEGPELAQMAETWPQIAPIRRQRLLEDLESLADSNYLVNFDEIFKLGLRDTVPHCRMISIRGLWENEEPAIGEEFVRLLTSDPDKDVRAQAANGLGKYIYLGEMEEIQESLYEKIKSLLIETVSGSHPEAIRRRALEAAGFATDKRVSALIEETYSKNKEDWLLSALVAMGRSANSQWVPQIIENLPHESSHIRLEAAQAAGLLAAQETVPHLLQLIDDPEKDVRQAAIWSLSEIGGMDARAALEELLKISKDEEEIDFLEESLDNLDVTDAVIEFDFLNLSEEDLELMIGEDEEDLEE
jgi:hypothetical protein